MYLHDKDPSYWKYQLLINGKKVGIKHTKNQKAFIDYSQTIDDAKQRKVLLVFDNITADMEANKKLSSIVSELFLRGRKLNISIVFLSQSYFKVPKTIRRNTFYHKNTNKREIQQIPWNHSSGIDFKDFMKLYKDYTKEPVPLLVNDTTLLSHNSLTFRKNLL